MDSNRVVTFDSSPHRSPAVHKRSIVVAHDVIVRPRGRARKTERSAEQTGRSPIVINSSPSAERVV